MASCANATMTSQTLESDSVDDDEASTTDDIDSSRQWTTDDLEGGGGVSEAGTSDKTTGTSNDEAEDDCIATFHKGSSMTPEVDQYRSMAARRQHRHHHHHSNHRRQRSNGKAEEGGEGENDRKAQSDTETKNLLGDVDFDEDNLDLEEAVNATEAAQCTPPVDDKLFEPSEEQSRYYSNCFLFLSEKIQGVASLSGALNGADPRMLEFFHRSRLDNTTLSRIWALSDVNEDGFLNHGEFITAMHLIVLHLKAKVPIPSSLPPCIRPLVTPVRHLTSLPDGRYYSSLTMPSTTDSTATTSSGNTAAAPDMIGIGSDNTSRGSTNSCALLNSWSLVNGTGGMPTAIIDQASLANDARTNNNCAAHMPTQQTHGKAVVSSAATTSSTTGGKQHSLSDDHLHIYAAAQQESSGLVTQFSNVPPLLVDSKPTALNASSALASLHTSMITRGPPPQPPVRDYQHTGNDAKGHGRSASLDLKTFVSLSSYPRKSPHPMLSRTEFPTRTNALNELSHGMEALSANCKETQTESDSYASRPVSMDCTNDSFPSVALPPQERCAALKRLNEQLENERVTLSQVRLQLQLRIDEMQAAQMQAKMAKNGWSRGSKEPGAKELSQLAVQNKPTSV